MANMNDPANRVSNESLATVPCAQCGLLIPTASKFCPECGVSQNSQESQYLNLRTSTTAATSVAETEPLRRNTSVAKAAFITLAVLFPIFGLVSIVAIRHDQRNQEVGRQEAANDAEKQHQQEEEYSERKHQQEEAMGTPIDFASLYAKVYGSGLEIGKRYVVHGTLTDGLTLLYATGDVGGGNFIGVEPDFDDSGRLESAMKDAVNSPSGLSCVVVLSMGDDHRVHVHGCYY